MNSEPFQNVETADLPPEHRRVIEISRDQFGRHCDGQSPIVWRAAAVCAAVTYGQKGSIPVTLALAEDGMAYCSNTSNGALLWCVSVRPPNACRVKNGAFWVHEIDGSAENARFGRIHPFMAQFSNPSDVAVPYVGALAILKGRKRVRAFREILRSVGADIR